MLRARFVGFVLCLAAGSGTAWGAAQVAFPPLRHGVKAVFGQNGNDHGGDLEGKGLRLVEAFRDLGVDLTRIEFKWAIVESTRGRYDWSEPDRLIGFLQRHGVEPMLMLYCAPKWAMRGRPEDEELFIRRGEQNLHTVVWPRRDCLPGFERFCEEAARRYAGRADLFEFWNEPDGMAGPIVLHDWTGKAVTVRYGGDAKEYTHWLKAMYTAVKRGNPKARVAAGSLCVHDARFVEAIYAGGGRDYCDAISLHPYAPDGVNVEWIRQVREIMCNHGDWDKPIWLSEFGWTHGQQYDAGTGGFPSTADEVARIIRATFPKIEALPYVTHSFFFTLNDWATDETGIDPVGVHSYGLLDLGFHRRPGFAAFRQVVAETPRRTRYDTAPDYGIAPPPGPIDVGPDGAVVVPLTQFSRDVGSHGSARESIAAGLRLTAPDLFDKDAPVEIVPSRPLRRAGAGVESSAPAGTPVRFMSRARRGAAPGTYSAGVELAGAVPVECLVTVPVGADRRDSPPVIDADLGEWSGRLDVVRESMRVGFGWDDLNLYFACIMTDTHHQQPYADENLWQGDCVQVSFDPLRDAIRGSRYDDNDTELALALSGDQSIIWRYACPPARYCGRMPDESVAVKRIGNETRCEAALPWREIGIGGPHAGQVIGVAVAGCDWEGKQRAVRSFGEGIIGAKEPYRFASIRLLRGGR